jgi:hypothetical protein
MVHDTPVAREHPVVTRLIGVYDADGTWRGEVAYWIGARLGRRHCSLCDVTHGMFTEKSDWKRCRATLPVPFDTFHRDDQPDEVRHASGDRAPVIVAETASGMVVLIDDADITSTGGNPDRLVDAIERAAGALGLTWP